MKYLDPVTLASLTTMHLRAQRVVEGLLSGLHASPYKGHSLEFAEHREYSRGDELRHIDWKVYGRSDKFFVKQFQNETNLRGYIVMDASASMSFASPGRVTKLEYAKYLAAALAYLLARQEDAVSLSVFDTAVRFFLPARHTLGHLSILLNKLEEVQGGGETAIAGILRGLGQQFKKRGLVIFISDLLDEPESVLHALKYLCSRHHEVIVLHIVDPEEVSFPFVGEKIFVNVENNTDVFVDADTIRREYTRLFKRFLDEYKIGFRTAGIDYNMVTTNLPVETALSQCLIRRA